MPVRDREESGDIGAPEPKRCRHCDESTHVCIEAGGAGGASGAEWEGDARAAGGCEAWRVTLDRDLVETLSAIYPEWFKPQNQQPNEQRGPAREDQNSDTTSSRKRVASSSPPCAGAPGMAAAPPPPPAPQPPAAPAPPSPPKAVVDASSLMPAMDRNKESLKVKLMMRRPLNQLVAQGIMPPLKTPPAFYEQRKQLERAKTGDLLKAKIQRRPDRQELERRHILELQEGHVDPSLAEKQRMLKKARLADQLNDQLSHRPGPLELIQKNILHTEEPIEDAVKRGLVEFKATSEGALRRPEHPNSYLGPDEESPTPSPPAPLPPPSPATSTLSPASAAASPRPAPSPSLLHPAPGKDKNRKKSKAKCAPKARTIKFHEYKGPPSAQKASSPPGGLAPAPGETSYELLLRQQQLFLQWQLESQHKYPQLLLSAACRPPPPPPAASPALAPSPATSLSETSDVPPESSLGSQGSTSHRSASFSDAGSPSPVPPPPPPFPGGRIEDMKVSDLKAELKRRNLPVSGPKPQLVERLRPFLGDRRTEERPPPSPLAPLSCGGSPEAMDAESAPTTPAAPPPPLPPEDVVRTQRRLIEELQRELERSQRQLEAVRASTAAGRAEPSGRRLALHHLQAKIQSHQLAAHIQQLEALRAAAERQRPPPPPPPPPPAPLAPIAPQPQYVLAAADGAHVAPERLLRFIATQGGEGLKMQFALKDGAIVKVPNGEKNLGLVLSGVKVVPITILPAEPPRYESPPVSVTVSEITPVSSIAPTPPAPATPGEDAVQSQTVDDVLEILIKNGELPASAAHIPNQIAAGNLNQNNEFIPADILSGNRPEVFDVNVNAEQRLMNDHDSCEAILLQNNIQNELNMIQNELMNGTGECNDLMEHSSNHTAQSHHLDLDLLGRDVSDGTLQNDFCNGYAHSQNENSMEHQDDFMHNELDHSMMNGESAALDHTDHEPMNEKSILDDLINQSSLQSDQNGYDLDRSHANDFDLSYTEEPLNVEHSPSHTRMFLDSDVARPEDGLDLRELGLDLDTLDADLGRAQSQYPSEYMDMDEWMESLWPATCGGGGGGQQAGVAQCDPLLGGGGAPAHPAAARPPHPLPHTHPHSATQHLSWDRIDFAAT